MLFKLGGKPILDMPLPGFKTTLAILEFLAFVREERIVGFVPDEEVTAGEAVMTSCIAITGTSMLRLMRYPPIVTESNGMKEGLR